MDISEDELAPLDKCDVVFKSPGVSLYRPEVQKLIRRGIPVLSGTNLFMEMRDPHQKLIAITGTKGKSTTSSLLAHTLKTLGVNVGLGGNIGIPLVELLNKHYDVVVAELSSYQCADFHGTPDIAVLLNLYPEHLQWHGTHACYYADKINMVRQAKASVYNFLDEKTKMFIGTQNPVYFNSKSDIHITNGFFMDGRQKLFPISSLNLIGEHNALNGCAVLTVIKLLGYDLKQAESAFRTFQSLPHRLENIWQVNGITYVDDSISTTPETAVAGLKSFDENRRITLIAGGLDRGQDFTCLIDYLAENKGRIFLITMPDTGDALYQLARGKGIGAFQAFTMEQAVTKAKSVTPAGGLVLLSPAAPSYNMYKNFEARGDDFKKWVLKS